MKRSLVLLVTLMALWLGIGEASACGLRWWYCPRPVSVPVRLVPSVIVCQPTPICPAPVPYSAPAAPLRSPMVTPESTPAVPTPASPPESPKPMNVNPKPVSPGIPQGPGTAAEPAKGNGVKPVDLAIPSPATPDPETPPVPKAPPPKPVQPEKEKPAASPESSQVPAPKPLQLPTEAATPGVKIPALKPPIPGGNDPAVPPLSIPNPPTTREAKSSPISGERAVAVDVFEVEGGAIASPTAKKRIGFFNHTDRELRLTVEGEGVTLPARHRITAEVPAKFTWSCDAADKRTAEVPLTSPGLDIVLRAGGK